MVAYTCYFLRGESAPALQTIECKLDDEAINHATSLLDQHYSIEIRKDTRLLARATKGASTEQHQPDEHCAATAG
jgi:hypothetical protein